MPEVVAGFEDTAAVDAPVHESVEAVLEVAGPIVAWGAVTPAARLPTAR